MSISNDTKDERGPAEQPSLGEQREAGHSGEGAAGNAGQDAEGLAFQAG